MTRALLISFFLIKLAGASYGQWGLIDPTSDANGCDSYFVDSGGMIQVYVWHAFTQRTLASQWMLDVANTGWIQLGNDNNFTLVLGTSVTGVSIAYELCLTGIFRLMTVSFSSNALASTCTYIRIVAAALPT